MSLRSVLGKWTPPVVADAVRRRRVRPLRFAGRPTSWAEAEEHSSGYSASTILDHVAEATRQVEAGEALFERDGVAFAVPETPFHVLTAVLRSALAGDRRAFVVDIGGSLGTTYRRCRPLLTSLSRVEWNVVEQPSFVALGRAEFSTEELRFHERVEDIRIENSAAATILLCSVLQYLPQPYQMLQRVSALSARHLVIDRTPLTLASRDHLTIQYASTDGYDASYPCWILSRQRLLEALAPVWETLVEVPGPEGSQRTDDGLELTFSGFILERRS